MADMMDRIADLRAESLNRLPETRDWLLLANREINGRASVRLAGELRFLAVADYKLDHDIPAFRRGLRECGELFVRLFERLDAGEPISGSYLSMITYQRLFNPLAAGDMAQSMRLAGMMGGREAIEKAEDNSFTRAFGYALKHLVEDKPDLAAPHVAALAQITRRSSRRFDGYATVMQALIEQNLQAALFGFNQIVTDHPRLTKGGGFFQNSADEVLCVWGVGLANLARARGLMVNIDNAWIPGDLLV